MSFSTPLPIISGVPFPVTEVAGRPPACIDDFVGETSFTVDESSALYHVSGVGGRAGEGVVRFQEKDVRGDAKDIRVWTVTDAGEGRFTALHEARF